MLKNIENTINLPIISIIIATFNSGKLLPMVFASLEKQTFPREKMEILILDGGSNDNTIDLSQKFGCRIINNLRTEPVYAKYLGYINAKGKYLAYLDHDEVIENPESLSLKVSILEKYPMVKAVIGSGYKNPIDYSAINNYVNEFGDPFSFFMYRLSKADSYFLPKMRKNYKIINEDEDCVVFNLFQNKKLPIIELVAACSMVDREFLVKEFPDTLIKVELTPHYFYLINSRGALIGVTKNDALFHYSADNLYKYLKKIRWRIKNNIYHRQTMGESGFSGREKFQSNSLGFKKYLFIPYAFSLIFPLFDALFLVVTRKKIFYLIHFPICLYTAILIIFYYFLKIFGFNPELRSYDESKVVRK